MAVWVDPSHACSWWTIQRGGSALAKPLCAGPEPGFARDRMVTRMVTMEGHGHGVAAWSRRLFYAFVVGVFLATSALKVVSLALGFSPMGVRDPLIVVVSTRQVVALATLLEAVVIVLLVGRASDRVKMLAVAWVSWLFATYRVGLWLIGYRGGCFCGGSPQSWVLFPKALNVDLLLKLALTAMLCVSSGALIAERFGDGVRGRLRGGRASTAPQEYPRS
jgi:hypothetical protein